MTSLARLASVTHHLRVAHPQMYDDDDPVLARLRESCLALPEAGSKVSHGRPTFHCGKVFAVYGGSVKLRPGDHEMHPHGLIFKPDPVEAAAYDEDERFLVPAYYGSAGWRMLDLDAPDVGWPEVDELLDASYRQVAPRRCVVALDEMTPERG